MTDGADRTLEDWLVHPLCCQYRCVRFESVAVRLPDDTAPRQVHWALAFHDEGRVEVLGPWLDSGPGGLDWPRVFAGLRERGVEGVRVDGLPTPAVLAWVEVQAQRVRWDLARTLRRCELRAGIAAVERELAATLQRVDRRLWAQRMPPSEAQADAPGLPLAVSLQF